MPPSLSILWAHKHIATSAVRDIHSGASSLLLPPPLSSSSSPRAHLPFPTPPPLSPISQARHRKSAASVVVPKSSSRPSLSPIPPTRHLFLILFWRLRCCCWVLGAVFLRHHWCYHHQFPRTVNTPLPPPSKTFMLARCLFYFLHRCFRHFRRFLGLIFLYWRLCHCVHFSRPVIETPQPPSSSPKQRRICCRLQSLGRVIFSLSSADASAVVVDSAVQSAWHRQLSPRCRSFRRIFSDYFLTTLLLSLPILGSCLPLPMPTLWN